MLLYIRRDKGVYYPLVNENVATELDKKRRKEAVGYEEDNKEKKAIG